MFKLDLKFGTYGTLKLLHFGEYKKIENSFHHSNFQLFCTDYRKFSFGWIKIPFKLFVVIKLIEYPGYLTSFVTVVNAYLKTSLTVKRRKLQLHFFYFPISYFLIVLFLVRILLEGITVSNIIVFPNVIIAGKVMQQWRLFTLYSALQQRFRIKKYIRLLNCKLRSSITTP